MDVFCITTNNPQFQKLLAESGEKQGVFAMTISKWMTQNEVYDRYPTLQELGITVMESIKPGVQELFESNPELANAVYEALGFKTNITQNNKSYYRGQIEQPTIDKDGNLVLYAREDELYKRAGLKSKGVSMTDDLQSAIEYGNGQLEVAQNLASENYDAEQELERLSENGYYLIQIPKDISNEIVKEAGEIKVIGDKIIISKGQYKIEQIIEGEETKITPQQKQQALQLYSQYLDTGKQDIEGFKDFVGSVEDKASESGLSLSSDEAAAYNSLVNDGTIPIKCK